VFVVLFGGVVIANGILAMIIIDVLQAVGWWAEPARSSDGPSVPIDRCNAHPAGPQGDDLI
jgi:hypothetical protein